MSSRVEISKKLVLINSASSLITNFLSVSVLIWLQQYLLKRITPEEYSLLPVVYSVMMFAPLVNTILTAGLGRYIVEAYAKGDEKRVTQIVSTMFPILCLAGFVFLIGGCTFAWYIDRVLNIAPDRVWDARIMIAMLMFMAAISLPLAPFNTGFFVRQKYVLLNLINVGFELCRFALLFTLLFAVSTRVMWVVTASVAAGLLKVPITLTISRRLVPALRFHFSHIYWPIAKEITNFGGWTFVASLANTIRTSADVIILNKFATPIDVTCFHIGSMALRQIQQTSMTVRSPLNPVLTAMYATGDTNRLRNTYLRGGRLSLWGVLFIVVPLMIFSQEVMTLYVGEAYRASATVMALLLAGPLIGYGNLMLPQIAQATAQVRPNAIRVFFTHSINLILTLYLVGALKKGAVGSALATFLVVGISQPMLMWPLGLRLARTTWTVWLRETIIPGMLPGLTAAPIWIGLKLVVRPESWLVLVECALCGAACYVSILLVFCLRPYDRAELRVVLKHIRRCVVSIEGG